MQDVLINSSGVITAIDDHFPDRYIDASARNINLDGKFLIPGLIDTHFHLMATGLSQLSINLDGISEIKIIQELLEAAAKSVEYGTWILATGFNEERLKEKPSLTRSDLDIFCPDRPIFIEHRSLHYAIANTVGLRILGLLEGKMSGRSGNELSNGIITGSLLHQSRVALMRSLDPHFISKALRVGSAKAAKKGITTLHAIEGGELFGNEYIQILIDIRDELDTWVNLYWITTDINSVLQKELKSLGGDILLDGTLGSRTAALWENYADKKDCNGKLYRIQAEVDEFFYKARQAGLQPAVHAIGGRAIEQALNAIEKAEISLPDIENRPRIEHFGEATKEQILRAARLQMGVASQPSFPYLRGGPGSVYYDRLGVERTAKIYAFRWLIDEGVLLAGGSDSPVVPLDPMLGIHACVNAHYPAQQLSAQEALKVFTVNGAWLGFEESIKGDIKVGMKADLVALDSNPFSIKPENIKKTKVLLTMKGGKIVFDALT